MFKEYAPAFLKQWWIWAIGIFLALLQVWLYFANGTIVYIWLGVAAIILSIIIAQYKVWVTLKTKFLALQSSLSRRNVLDELAKLRESGVTLRNEGMRTNKDNESEQKAWWDKAVQWDEEVRTKLNQLAPHESTLFGTLDWVDFPIEPFLEPHIGQLKIESGLAFLDKTTAEHINQLRIHSQRLRSLKDTIVRYSIPVKESA